MLNRSFGRTGISVSEVGLGTWQIGSSWGDVSEEESLSICTQLQKVALLSSIRPTFMVMDAAKG
jgi:hypothetical protein